MTEEFGMISTFGGRTPAPTVDEDQVLIAGVAFGWGDNARGQHRIFAFNKDTGELNWTDSTGGIPVDAPQNTPVIAVIKGQRLVIFAAGDGGDRRLPGPHRQEGLDVQGLQARHQHVRRHRRRAAVLLARAGQPRHQRARPDLLPRHRQPGRERQPEGSLEDHRHRGGVPDGGGDASKYLYVVDDRGRLYQIDKETGKIDLEEARSARVGKPSPVYARRKAVRRRRRRAVHDHQARREAVGHEGAEQGRADGEARPRIRDLRLAGDRGRADLPPDGDEAVLHRE